ncbi:unnamed protein product [Prorocentrum cordatum]|uniref:Methyltransferase FkbM domain-containing protein n=1 Tax=Prorocentrum cordatum TaxID=2364126 RepID=A0ABN9SPD1_9DINO|nr:unnamed protein product [Polarella glacialis]
MRPRRGGPRAAAAALAPLLLLAAGPAAGAPARASAESSACASRCGALGPLLREAAALTGAPAPAAALAELRGAGEEALAACPLAKLVLQLGLLYFSGPGAAAPLGEFLSGLDACDLTEAGLFRIARLSRPQMAHAFWLMSGASASAVPRQLLARLGRNGTGSGDLHRPCRRLAFDLGSGHGDDAAFYQALGFCVVATDAQPGSMGGLPRGAGRSLMKLRRAIVAEDGPVTIRFFVCGVDVTRSSTDPALGENPDWCQDQRTVEVLTTTCGQLVGDFGAPAHVKVDVEGADLACLDSMLPVAQPGTISVEVPVGQAGRADVQASIRLLQRLQRAGYRRFKLCRRAEEQRAAASEPAELGTGGRGTGLRRLRARLRDQIGFNSFWILDGLQTQALGGRVPQLMHLCATVERAAQAESGGLASLVRGGGLDGLFEDEVDDLPVEADFDLAQVHALAQTTCAEANALWAGQREALQAGEEALLWRAVRLRELALCSPFLLLKHAQATRLSEGEALEWLRQVQRACLAALQKSQDQRAALRGARREKLEGRSTIADVDTTDGMNAAVIDDGALLALLVATVPLTLLIH